MSQEIPRAPRHVKDNAPDACCSFCGRLRSETDPMVEGPNEVYICVNCVMLASRIAGDIVRNERSCLEALQKTKSPWEDDPFPTPSGAACSFCSRTRAETGPLVVGPNDVFVCYRCSNLTALMFAKWRDEGRFTPEQLPPSFEEMKNWDIQQ